MQSRGQTGIEYLLIIGGVLVVALIIGSYLITAASSIYNSVTGVSGVSLEVAPIVGALAYWEDTNKLSSIGFSLVDVAAKTITFTGKLFASDFCIPGGPCLSTVSGGGGGSVWSVNGSDIYYDKGKVGIGTNSPSADLEVNVSAEPGVLITSALLPGTVAPVLRFLDSLSGNWFQIRFFRSANKLFIESKSTEKILTVTSDGNVGIKTSTPSYTLDVNGAVSSKEICLNGSCIGDWSEVNSSTGSGSVPQYACMFFPQSKGCPPGWTHFSQLDIINTNTPYSSSSGPDIVYGGADGAVHILINDGSSYQDITTNIAYTSPISESATLTSTITYYVIPSAIADVDGDSKNDLIIRTATNKITVYKQNDPSTFNPVSTITTSNSIFAVDAGDVDGDNVPEIVVGIRYDIGGPKIIIYKNNGGTYSEYRTITAGDSQHPYLYSIALGDVDGDGDKDIIALVNDQDYDKCLDPYDTSASCDPIIQIYSNDGTGNFTNTLSKLLPYGSVIAPDSAAAADIEGDGHDEIVYISIVGYKICSTGEIIGRGLIAKFDPDSETGTIVYSTTSSIAWEISGLGVGDMDGDGDVDISFAVPTIGNNCEYSGYCPWESNDSRKCDSSTETDSVYILYNDGAGNFSLSSAITSSAKTVYGVGEIDGTANNTAGATPESVYYFCCNGT